MTMQSELNDMGKSAYIPHIDTKDITHDNKMIIDTFTYTLDKNNDLYKAFIVKYPAIVHPSVITIIVIPYVANITDKKYVFYFNDYVQVKDSDEDGNVKMDSYIPIIDVNDHKDIMEVIADINANIALEIKNLNESIILSDNLSVSTISDSTTIEDKIAEFDNYPSLENSVANTNTIFDFISKEPVAGIRNIPIKFMYQTFNDNHRDLIIVGDMNVSNLFEYNNGKFTMHEKKNSTTVTQIEEYSIIKNLDADLTIEADEFIEITLDTNTGDIGFIRTVVDDSQNLTVINDNLTPDEYYINPAMIENNL